ncbi:MAG: guanine deaminase, partial [Rhodobacteraceae bacterium]
MAGEFILKGRVLSFTGSPFDGVPQDAARLDEAVVVGGGKVVGVGGFADLRAAHPR